MVHTPDVIVPRVIVGAAVILAVIIARRDRSHLPLAVALGGVLASDLVRAYVALPPRVELALYLTAPALSAWCALRVLARLGPWSAPVAPLVLWGAVLRRALTVPEFWEQAHRVGHVGSLVVQIAAAVVFWISPRGTRLPETCAMVLAWGDVIALAGPLGFPEAWAEIGWEWAAVAAQAGVIGAVLVVLQIRELLTPPAGTQPGDERAAGRPPG
ncbi:hypothetical protein [Sorangium sp. So ce1000]|uniref:hypothetical protein n=1 Tax=Sorangium sp. So ce1000 TaxID=3133325 RepID=UPI003F5F9150